MVWGSGAGSLTALRRGRLLQSSIRSRWADQSVLRCSGAQSSGRPSSCVSEAMTNVELARACASRRRRAGAIVLCGARGGLMRRPQLLFRARASSTNTAWRQRAADTRGHPEGIIGQCPQERVGHCNICNRYAVLTRDHSHQRQHQTSTGRNSQISRPHARTGARRVHVYGDDACARGCPALPSRGGASSSAHLRDMYNTLLGVSMIPTQPRFRGAIARLVTRQFQLRGTVRVYYWLYPTQIR